MGPPEKESHWQQQLRRPIIEPPCSAASQACPGCTVHSGRGWPPASARVAAKMRAVFVQSYEARWSGRRGGRNLAEMWPKCGRQASGNVAEMWPKCGRQRFPLVSSLLGTPKCGRQASGNLAEMWPNCGRNVADMRSTIFHPPQARQVPVFWGFGRIS